MRAAAAAVMVFSFATAAADAQIAREDNRIRDVNICVMPFGSVDDARVRFEKLYENVRVTAKLDRCHLAIAPSEWLSKDADAFAEARPAIERWVRAGGSLLVFQPNPGANEDVPIELLGTWFRVNNWYLEADGAAKVIEHPIVANVSTRDLPFPADRITAFDAKHWTAIVRGAKSQNASLIVGTFGKGRVAVDTDNPNAARGIDTDGGARHTDAFVRALVGWLVEKRPARTAWMPWQRPS